jgi:orotidine-5'-phosphate decarboxylase
VAEHLSDEITRRNHSLCGGDELGPIGAVVGLTAEHAPRIAARLPHSLLLVPGLGAQGGSFSQLAERFGPASSRAIPSASRSVLGCGPDAGRLRTAILQHCEAAAAALS